MIDKATFWLKNQKGAFIKTQLCTLHAEGVSSSTVYNNREKWLTNYEPNPQLGF